MANRRTKYLGQTITAEEWNDSDDQAELADRNIMADMGFFGIVNGLAVAQKSSPTLHVDAATGVAYDQQGRRVRVPGTQDINLTNDSNGVPTAVSSSGNSKIVSVFVRFTRATADPRYDESEPPQEIFWQSNESFEFVVVQGSEAVSPTPPALLADGVLLADVTRTFEQTQILTANIALAGRRQDLMVVSGSPSSIRQVSVKDTIAELLTIANDASANLSATTTGASGAHLVGVAAQTGAPGALGAGNLFDRLELLRNANNLHWDGGTTWADSSTNPAASVGAQLDKIIVDLRSSDAGGIGPGAGKIGAAAVGNFQAGSVQTSFQQLTRTASADDGALRVGAQASGGLSEGTVRSQLTELDTEKLSIAALASTTGGSDGALLVGAEAEGALAAGTVRSQLDALSDRAAVAWARLACDGAGNVAVVDEEGGITASVGSTFITVTFTTAFANTDYCPVVSSLDGPTHRQYRVNASSLTTTSMHVYVVDPINDVTVDPTANICRLSVQVMGRR